MIYKALTLLTIILFSTLGFAADRAVISPESINTISGEELFSTSAAFVAGVSDYDSGWADLPGVKNDMDSVISILSSRGFTIEKALDNTKAEFLGRFESFISRYANDSKARLLIYFAGHGHTLKTSNAKDGYIVLKDATVPKKNIAGFKSGSIPMSYFADKAKNIKAQHVLFVFDSCFSGSLFSTMRSVPEFLIELLNKPVRQFITSGTENQMVPDDSVFRRRFVDGMKGEADADGDGIVTGSELGLYLQASVTGYTSGTQTPIFGKMQGYDGEFVFFNKNFKVRDNEAINSSEKEELLALIKKNPHSPDASEALARLREIDESLQNNPPVMAPERKNFTMSAKSVKRTKFNRNQFPYIVIAPIEVSSMGGEFRAAFRVRAKDSASYKKLNERRFMLRSVMSRRMKESNLQLIDDIVQIRERMREAAYDAAEWVCPGCTVQKPVIAGLMGL